MFKIYQLDHLVLTVKNLEETIRFYTQALGMSEMTYADGRKALLFGDQKINLHEAGKEFEPKSQFPTPGSADLCFITKTPITAVISHLNTIGIAILEGPVSRMGAQNQLESVYVRDPDLNLIEISNEVLDS